jgi:hypothetical protein
MFQLYSHLQALLVQIHTQNALCNVGSTVLTITVVKHRAVYSKQWTCDENALC